MDYVRAYFMKRYFEYKDDTSSKFWEIIISENIIITRYGKIGTQGQTSEKAFADEEKAQKEYSKLVKEKTGKGYLEIANQDQKTVNAPAEKSTINTTAFIDSLIAECIANDPGASAGENPMMYWASLKDYPSITKINKLDVLSIKELTFDAIKKFKEVITNKANAEKITREKRVSFGEDYNGYYEWLEEWRANDGDPNQYGYSSALVEDCLERLIQHLLRWHYNFTDETDFTMLLEAFEFEVYSTSNKRFENNYWKFPISLVLGKLNVFASYNDISENCKNLIASYPKNKVFNIAAEDWNLESAEIFFEAIQDRRIAKSANSVFYNQSKAFPEDVKSYLHELIEEALLVGNPDNSSDFCKLTDFSTLKSLTKKNAIFKAHLTDFVYEQILFFYKNSQSWASPYGYKNGYVLHNVLDKLLSLLLKTHIDFNNEKDIVSYFQKFNVIINLQEETLYGFSIFKNQAKILTEKLTKLVEKDGMSEQLSQFLIQVVSKFVKLKGVLEMKTVKPEISTYTKQVTETGKIEIKVQQEAQSSIIDWCSINDDAKLIQGNLYNIGFFPKSDDPEQLAIDATSLAKDMDFLDTCKALLDDAGCTNWRFNNTTGIYYPFIINKPMESHSDIFQSLCISPSEQKTPFMHYGEESSVPKIISVDFFDDERTCIDEELENDEDADVEDAKNHLIAYDTVNDMLRENTVGAINEFAILAGYDHYPIFKIGKSKTSGNYIGFIALMSNRYIYGE
jgi:predicted DNA-binding WGR domain protein